MKTHQLLQSEQAPPPEKRIIITIIFTVLTSFKLESVELCVLFYFLFNWIWVSILWLIRVQRLIHIRCCGVDSTCPIKVVGGLLQNLLISTWYMQPWHFHQTRLIPISLHKSFSLVITDICGENKFYHLTFIPTVGQSSPVSCINYVRVAFWNARDVKSSGR